MISRGRYLLFFSCIILGMLSTKRAYAVDSELKFRILSMETGVFVDGPLFLGVIYKFTPNDRLVLK